MLKLVPLVAAGLIVASPAVSQTTPSAAPTQGAAKQDDPNKKICEIVEETGSRLDRKRVCHTAAQWAEIRAQTQANLQRVQQQSTGLPSAQ
ncbi:MAG TPA: hypothetical protein VJM15_02605 [Sphingomicrobium sp.]|nr:hypothetical protein [Sphingomicrobium sp.]